MGVVCKAWIHTPFVQASRVEVDFQALVGSARTSTVAVAQIWVWASNSLYMVCNEDLAQSLKGRKSLLSSLISVITPFLFRRKFLPLLLF